MVNGEYVPERGHLVWIEFSPHAGQEPAGQRSALVLSAARHNRERGIALVCPISSGNGNGPFEIELDSDTDINRGVMSRQVTSVDWRARNARYAGKMEPSAVDAVIAKVAAFLET